MCSSTDWKAWCSYPLPLSYQPNMVITDIISTRLVMTICEPFPWHIFKGELRGILTCKIIAWKKKKVVRRWKKPYIKNKQTIYNWHNIVLTASVTGNLNSWYSTHNAEWLLDKKSPYRYLWCSVSIILFNFLFTNKSKEGLNEEGSSDNVFSRITSELPGGLRPKWTV